MGAGELFLGVDVGATVVKAGVYSADGTCVALNSVPALAVNSARGFNERDMEGLWDAASGAVEGVLRAANAPPAAIAAVGVTGFGNGLLLLDQSGNPIGNAIASTDSRAHPIVAEWLRLGVADAIRSRTWQTLWPGQPLALFAWLERQAPDLVGRAAALVMCKDFIRYRMTGEIAAELTDLSSAGLIDGKTGSYDRSTFQALGVQRVYPLLPQRVLLPSEVCGAVSPACASRTGLTVGTPVVAGMADGLALLLGSGVTADDTLSIVSGTWSLNQRLAPAPVLPEAVFGSIRTFDPKRFLVTDNSAAGASNLDWFIDVFMSSEVAAAAARGQSIYEVCDAEFDQVDPHDPTVVFLPFVHGSREAPGATAAFFGFTSRHRRSHALRAVYEGVTFEHRLHVERLVASTGGARAVRLAGGVVASPPWIQLFADILGLDIEVPAHRQLGALGAAMTAAIGVNAVPGYPEAAAGMTSLARVVSPRPELAELYTRRYGTYKELRERAIDSRLGHAPDDQVAMGL
jgi:L-xylulokinase